jgi:hypothetical protein
MGVQCNFYFDINLARQVAFAWSQCEVGSDGYILNIGCRKVTERWQNKGAGSAFVQFVTITEQTHP